MPFSAYIWNVLFVCFEGCQALGMSSGYGAYSHFFSQIFYNLKFLQDLKIRSFFKVAVKSASRELTITLHGVAFSLKGIVEYNTTLFNVKGI